MNPYKQPKTKASRAQISMIHTLKSKAGVTDDDYRAMLESFGVESSKELTSPDCKVFIGSLLKLAGQEDKTTAFPTRKKRAFDGIKSASGNDTSTYAQQAKIKHLWSIVSRAPAADQERALNQFLEKRFAISRLEWLPRERVGKVIKTLETMQKNQNKGEPV